jgi:predicted dehydrogenase
MQLETIVKDPIHLDFRRISPFSARAARDSVVRDLMIHDIDLACFLAGGDVTTVSAVARRTRGDTDDLVVALLTFAGGTTAALTASRIGQQKIREIEVTQAANFVRVDLVREEVTIHRVDHVEFLAEGGPRYSQAGVVEIPFLSNRGEPLALEWAHFVRCVCAGETPRVSGEDALRALAIAERVEQAARLT